MKIRGDGGERKVNESPEKIEMQKEITGNGMGWGNKKRKEKKE